MVTKAYTGAGDKGFSSWFGAKIKKSELEFEVLGVLDELNSTIGFSIVSCADENKKILKKIQKELFELGSDLSTKSKNITKEKIDFMEKTIDELNSKLPALKKFVLPDGCEAAARLHLARTIARKAERRIWILNEKKKLPEEIPAYLNRLSSLLFVLARYENFKANYKEEFWP